MISYDDPSVQPLLDEYFPDRTDFDREAIEVWLAAYEGDYSSSDLTVSALDYEYYDCTGDDSCGQSVAMVPTGVKALEDGVWTGDFGDLDQDINSPDPDLFIWLQAEENFSSVWLRLTPILDFVPKRCVVRVSFSESPGVSGRLTAFRIFDGAATPEDMTLGNLDRTVAYNENGNFDFGGYASPGNDPTIRQWFFRLNPDWDREGASCGDFTIQLNGIVTELSEGGGVYEGLKIHAVEVEWSTWECDCPEWVYEGDGTARGFTQSIQITDGTDDAWFHRDGTTFTSTDARNRFGTTLVGGPEQTTALTFHGVNVPQGAKIHKAVIEVMPDADGAQGGDDYVDICGHCASDSSPVTSAADGNSRDVTAAHVEWDLSDSTSGWSDSTPEETPNVGPILEEIVNHEDWESGNSVTFFFRNSGSQYARWIVSADSTDGTDAPILHLWYSPVVRETMSGGITFGGVNWIYNPDGDSLLFGGEADYFIGFIDIGEGGVLFSGEAVVLSGIIFTMEGGVKFGDASFPNGFRYRVLVTVPAGVVTEDIPKFYLGVGLELDPSHVLTGTDFRVEDMDGNVKYHDLRAFDSDTGQTVLFWKADLKAIEDVSFWVYFGKETA